MIVSPKRVVRYISKPGRVSPFATYFRHHNPDKYIKFRVESRGTAVQFLQEVTMKLCQVFEILCYTGLVGLATLI